MRITLVLFLALCVGTAARAQSPSNPTPAGTPPPARTAAPAAASAVRLGPGDAVRVLIGGDGSGPAGERAAVVRPTDYPVTEEGTVLLPMVGLVAVAGRPFPEVRAEILAGYARKLVETPVVVVPVLRIAVLGEVRQPGLIPVDPTFTLADILAAAGGLTPLGDPGRIVLLRAGDAHRFSLDEASELLAQSPRSGDQLLVSRRSWMRENLNVLIAAGASVVAAAVTSLILSR